MSGPSRNPLDDVPPVDETTLVCEVGDRLEVLADTPMQDDQDMEAGAIYRVSGRVYYGWDLERESGGGPELVRMLNSKVLPHFRILPRETP